MHTIDITTEEKPMTSYRTVARIAGLLLFAGILFSLPTDLTESLVTAPDYLTSIAAHSTQVMGGALVAFLSAVISGSTAIALYPVLRKQNEGLALGAVGFGLIQAIFYFLNVLGLIALVMLSQDFVKAGAPDASAYHLVGSVIQAARSSAIFTFGVSASGLSELLFFVVFYQSRLIPRWLAGWGVFATLCLLIVAFVVLFGVKPGSPLETALNLPIVTQQIVLIGWLMFKGFTPSALASLSAQPAVPQ